MKPDQAKGVAGQITWFDGSAGGKACCFITGDMRTISGGRLGRNHTLEDVPTCYVRDRVMDYINDQLPEEKRADVRRAVFSDLTEAEINLYSALIAEERIEAEAETPPPQETGNVETSARPAAGGPVHHRRRDRSGAPFLACYPPRHLLFDQVIRSEDPRRRSAAGRAPG
jgi:hypothetical protein